MIKTIIFDFDGVIAKTMEKHAQAYKEALSEAGVWIKPRAVYLAEGALPEAMVSRLLRKPIDPQVKKLANRKKELFMKYRKYIQPEKDAIKLIKKLKKKGLKVGVATGGNKRNFELIMKKDRALLDFYLGGEDVNEGKPNPEIYLEAAKAAGTKPEECIVIENSINGIKAAKEAGMTCIAITTTLKKEDLHEADYVTKNFKEIEQKIEEIRESTS